jgi:O-antigen ligase
MLGVYFICGVYVLAPGLMGFGAQEAGRMRFGIDALGYGDKGVGASSISLIVGVAFFFGLRLWFNSHFQTKSIFTSPLKWFLCGGLVLGVYAIVGFSGSRQGLIWIALVGATFIAMKARKNLFVSALGAVAMGILVLGVVLLFFRDLEVVQRFLVIFDSRMRAIDPEKSFMGRAELIQFGLQMWRESPFWGHGNEAFRIQSGGTYSHNNYIELLANYGLIGFTLFYIPQLIAFFGAVRKAMTGAIGTRASYIWISMSLFAIFVSNIFLPSYYMRPMVVFISFIIGYYAFLKSLSVREFQPNSHAIHHRR